MAQRRLAGTPLDFGALRAELGVPGEFSAAALADAQRAAAHPPQPDVDRTDIEFITVDPAGSKDLDQALHIAADDAGFLVSYAIADVGSYVAPGSALDLQARARGETFYFPDARVPLHPVVLSEGAASLLPGQRRAAVLWQLRLDADGEPKEIEVQRAVVTSRARWDYPNLQRAITDGSAPAAAELLPRVGELRAALARRRHAIELNLPEQEVVADRGSVRSSWTLTLRAPTAIEAANAEISLLTGMCAATLMLGAGIGILRTLPEPDERTVAALQRIAPALEVVWPAGMPSGDVLATLDPGKAPHAAFLDHASSLLRGAGYTTFAGLPPADAHHAGVGAPYTHVTAPLRRLVDRFATEICLAIKAKTDVPDWVLQALPDLPAIMRAADQRAHLADRAIVDATEAFLLQQRTGDRFAAVVLSAETSGGTVAIEEPAIRARCDGADLPVGERIPVVLVAADVATRTVRFARS